MAESASITPKRIGDPVTAVLRGPAEIAEDEASDAVAALYARLRDALEVRFIPTVFRMLARHELYLAAAVDALTGGIDASTRHAFAQRARGVTADALDAGGAGGAVTLGTGGEHAEVVELLTRYHEANPRGMLVVRALARGVRPATGVMSPPLPPPAPELLADVRACHGGFTVPGMWRELHARHPAVALGAWPAVRELATTPGFDAARAAVMALADEAMATVTPPRPAELGADPTAVAEIEEILAWFSVGIPSMVVEIEYLLGGRS
jgi:hypothetical protein